MKKSISQTSSKSGNARLKEAFQSSADFIDEIADADVFADIATCLYRLRKNANIRQKDLAEALHVQQSNISRYETPGYTGYTIKMLLRYVRKLNGKLNISISPPSSNYTVHITAPLWDSGMRDVEFVNEDGSHTTKSVRMKTEIKHTISFTNTTKELHNGTTQAIK